MNFVDAINAFELVWWTMLGVMVLAHSLMTASSMRRLEITTAIFLILFGLSDGIELYTKAWWNPWWLMVLKGICIAGLVGCAIWWNRSSRRTDTPNL